MAQRTASTTLRNSTSDAVAGALDDAAVMHGDRRVDQIAAQRPEPRQNAILVGPREPAVADHVRGQDRRDLSGLAQWRAPPAAIEASTETRRTRSPRHILCIKPKRAPAICRAVGRIGRTQANSSPVEYPLSRPIARSQPFTLDQFRQIAEKQTDARAAPRRLTRRPVFLLCGARPALAATRISRQVQENA